jgi:galactofuranosylgalactofuranosylrhamnosyl-N-acetylglucosaminyl-diphospho-decaprenol beta-1,5/1,6-galactofuranosyltransferase
MTVETDHKLTDPGGSVRVLGVPREHNRRTVLQRIILPRDEDPLDVRPLYLDEPEHTHCHVSSRRAVTIPASAKVSFATYFNAFPASYWKRWTSVQDVVLRLRVRGTGRIDLYRSKATGGLLSLRHKDGTGKPVPPQVVHLEGKAVRSAAEWSEVEFTVSLIPFEDGGWIWFDVFTDDTTLEIDEAAWTVTQPLPLRQVAVGITTFNRVPDCIEALASLAEDPAVLEVVSKVVVADQGTQKIRQHERFTEVVRALGGRLEVIEQDNLGGSGGFSRAMYEGVHNSNADQVLLLDDDIRLEPDSLLRSNAFASATTKPVIVGSHMLNLQARSRLHSMGEIVDLNTCYWRAAPGAVTDHDFGEIQLREDVSLHGRVDATYNGWWMCLFPREVIEHTGMPLPLFIKWDDAEYSLRALAKGYPTVSLPGSAVWHMPWTDKNDATDWTTYFHVRNRLIMAALHSPYDVKTNIIKQQLKLTLRHLLSMEYSTVALQLKAVDDFLAGPDRLFDALRTALPEVRALRSQFDDAKTLPSAREFPPPTYDMVRAEQMLNPPVATPMIALRAAKAMLHNLQDPLPAATDRPQINIPATNARWFLLGNLDSATVSNADGSGVTFRKRDPKLFRKLMKQAFNTYRRLQNEWPAAQRAYRNAVPDLISVESWRKIFTS